MPTLTAEMEAEARKCRIVRRKMADTGEVLAVTVRVGEHGTLQFSDVGRVIRRRPDSLNLPRFLFQRASSLARNEFQGKIEEEDPFKGINVDVGVFQSQSEKIAEDHVRCCHCGYLDPARPRPEICPGCDNNWRA